MYLHLHLKQHARQNIAWYHQVYLGPAQIAETAQPSPAHPAQPSPTSAGSQGQQHRRSYSSCPCLMPHCVIVMPVHASGAAPPCCVVSSAASALQQAEPHVSVDHPAHHPLGQVRQHEPHWPRHLAVGKLGRRAGLQGHGHKAARKVRRGGRVGAVALQGGVERRAGSPPRTSTTIPCMKSRPTRKFFVLLMSLAVTPGAT